ncbi:ABC transporter permease YtrF precursor [bacterium BMS3Abin03]|nr:ABC transporter permease YtrF precursor [bacterium BMS3Abin03]GBD89627.1 ABC transporter permease YtrF precursor [bacterium BMS3Abin04]
MNTILKMAWRNIWRNKRRTILMMLSIFIAVVLSLFTRSMQKGTYANMIANTVKLSTGYIQIHKKGYWDNKSINETFVETTKLRNLLSGDKNLTLTLPRLESFALASSGKHTKGAVIIGTNPKLEDSLNHYSKKIIKGKYFKSNDKAVLVSDKLAEFLQLSVDDTLVLIGQGYHGITAAAKYPIKGIFHFPIPQLDNQLILMPLKESQYFYAAPNRITSISLMLNNPGNEDKTIIMLRGKLGNNYEVMPWQDMNREMVQAIESDNVGGIIMIAILYMVIGFGVFGTVMMMTMERRKEFAIMIAVGMKKTKLLTMVVWETVFIGIVAILAGLLVTYPLLLYLFYHPIPLTGDLASYMIAFGAEPILPFSLEPNIFIIQTISVIIISIIAVLYPLSVLLRFNVLKAMRS